MSVSIPVILGTVRHDNETEPVADYTLDRVKAHDETETRLVDPGKYELGNLEQRLTDSELRESHEQEFVDVIEDADGFVIVTPEYNHGYPGALKNLLDHVYEPWHRKAFGLVTTGGSMGGVRAEEQLRLVINGGLNGQVVPRNVNVPEPWDTFKDSGEPDEKPKTWQKRFDKLVDQVVVYSKALQDVQNELDG